MHIQYLVLTSSLLSLAFADPISGWAYQGCYSDSVSNRVLSGDSYTGYIIQELCQEFCGHAGYGFAGAEYGSECYCGHVLSSSSIKEPESDCYMTCSANSSQTCGGPNRMTLFSTGNAPVVNPGPNGWTSLGCYSDKTTSRTLQNAESIPAGPAGMTVAACTAKCQQFGYRYAGLEYANECYCGDSIINGAGPISSGCSMTCAGNSSEYCGGANSLNLYQSSSAGTSGAISLPSGWSSLGCWTDSVNSRTLAYPGLSPGSNVTIENCLSTCQSKGYSLAGLEYSQECWCDNKVNNVGQCALDSGCNMHCNGNPAELCGGSNRLNIYELGSGTIASCATSQTSTVLSSSTTTITTGSASFLPTTSGPSSFTVITTTTTISVSGLPVSPSPTTTTTSPTSSTTSQPLTTSFHPYAGGPCGPGGGSYCAGGQYILECWGTTLSPGNCDEHLDDPPTPATCVEPQPGYAYCTDYASGQMAGRRVRS